jgi:DNA processing protein
MQENTVRAYLALHKIPGLSNRQRCALLLAAGSEAVFQWTPTQLYGLGIDDEVQQKLKHLSNLSTLSSAAIERDWQIIQQQQIQLIPINSEDYPALLQETADPPALLYLKGNKSLLSQPQLAMVGSRRASAQGKENAWQFAKAFAAVGFVINSGLALGIDASSHRGALAAEGGTIAVLGTGIDVIYPKRNRALFEEIQCKGAVISEFPLGSEPRRAFFPQRNRIISGMSLGVLVVEATLNSGSLITARCALEQGREVFAIPGSIHNPASKGCHDLLKKGAKMVESVNDVMEELSAWTRPLLPIAKHEILPTIVPLNSQEDQLIQWLGYDPTPIEQLLWRSEWQLTTLIETLTTLELKGRVVQIAGNYQVINPQMDLQSTS